MSPPEGELPPKGDDAVPEPLPADKVDVQTGEVSTLPPERQSQIIEEIRSVAESRGDDSEVFDLLDIPPTGPIPVATTAEAKADDDALSVDELRDAWPLLDLA